MNKFLIEFRIFMKNSYISNQRVTVSTEISASAAIRKIFFVLRSFSRFSSSVRTIRINKRYFKYFWNTTVDTPIRTTNLKAMPGKKLDKPNNPKSPVIPTINIYMENLGNW